MKKKTISNSIENYEQLEKYRDTHFFPMIHPTILMCMQKNYGKFNISSKLFLLLCYGRHRVMVTDRDPGDMNEKRKDSIFFSKLYMPSAGFMVHCTSSPKCKRFVFACVKSVSYSLFAMSG